ncbi:MAG: hypothetical protein CVV27_00125 [Candidatus Melainabacteria bacterium HGW-Melainabacteria-1]|nr:MAG: hypothetical protein CVV27_00125 [Candidatus Melainabacteria bacterium HGW-Melainabacteria-1]
MKTGKRRKSAEPSKDPEAIALETKIAESLRQLSAKPSPIGFYASAAKGALRVQYIRNYWPANNYSPQVQPEDLKVTAAEVAEYLAYCFGEQVSPDQISEAQLWQFTVRKNEFFLDETIPFAEKRERERSLTAWHPIGCKYGPNGYDYRDDWYKSCARRCMELSAFQVEFVQPLAQGEKPKPVPGAVLKEIRDGLKQHIQAQQTILQELRRLRVPLWVQAGKEIKLLWPAEICFISSEAAVGLEVFTTAGERWPCFHPLASLEQQFAAEPDFMRTSRQHLVNLSHIDRVQPAGRGRDLTFRSQPEDIKARVTDSYLKAFLKRLGR